MSPRGSRLPLETTEEEAREYLRRALEIFPSLTPSGINPRVNTRDWVVVEIQKAADYVRRLEPAAARPSVANTFSSYGLKHWAENWWRRRVGVTGRDHGINLYVSNGALVTAALQHAKFVTATPNVRFSFTKRSIKRLGAQVPGAQTTEEENERKS